MDPTGQGNRLIQDTKGIIGKGDDNKCKKYSLSENLEMIFTIFDNLSHPELKKNRLFCKFLIQLIPAKPIGICKRGVDFYKKVTNIPYNFCKNGGIVELFMVTLGYLRLSPLNDYFCSFDERWVSIRAQKLAMEKINYHLRTDALSIQRYRTVCRREIDCDLDLNYRATAITLFFVFMTVKSLWKAVAKEGDQAKEDNYSPVLKVAAEGFSKPDPNYHFYYPQWRHSLVPCTNVWGNSSYKTVSEFK